MLSKYMHNQPSLVGDIFICRTVSESADHEMATIHHSRNHGSRDATGEEEGDVYTEIPSDLQRYKTNKLANLYPLPALPVFTLLPATINTVIFRLAFGRTTWTQLNHPIQSKAP
jgi:hypothetical protein